MNRIEALLEAKRAFRAGKNVTQHMRGLGLSDLALQDVIEFAYDLQAGSYTARLEEPQIRSLSEKWGTDVAAILDDLGATSVCEAGVGEATTLRFVAGASKGSMAFSGFDISLSRLLFAQRFLATELPGRPVKLFAADLLHIPLPDNAVDTVITNHSVEPNGGAESEILRELHRVAARYLVLIEPDYERGSDEQKQRMTSLNYIRGLTSHLEKLAGRIVRDEPWPHNPNPLNKASLIIFQKNSSLPASRELQFVTPVSKLPLIPLDHVFYSRDEGVAYPVISGIPVLRDKSAVVVSHLEQFCAGTPFRPA